MISAAATPAPTPIRSDRATSSGVAIVHGDQAWRREHRDRVAAERVQGVDLLRDLHRPELGGDPRAHPPDQDEGRHHGPELEHDARGHDAAEHVERDRGGELVAALLGRDDTREDGGDRGQRKLPIPIV